MNAGRVRKCTSKCMRLGLCIYEEYMFEVLLYVMKKSIYAQRLKRFTSIQTSWLTNVWHTVPVTGWPETDRAHTKYVCTTELDLSWIYKPFSQVSILFVGYLVRAEYGIYIIYYLIDMGLCSALRESCRLSFLSLRNVGNNNNNNNNMHRLVIFVYMVGLLIKLLYRLNRTFLRGRLRCTEENAKFAGLQLQCKSFAFTSRKCISGWEAARW